MSDNEVPWLLETIKDEWPDGGAEGFPEDVYRINDDEPRILETDEYSRSVEFREAATITATKGNGMTDPMSVDFNFSVEQPVTLKIEGLNESQRGTIASDSEFDDTLVGGVKEAIKKVRKHPPIDAGPRYYHTITFEGEDNLDSNKRDYYRRDVTIHFHGNEIRDD